MSRICAAAGSYHVDLQGDNLKTIFSKAETPQVLESVIGQIDALVSAEIPKDSKWYRKQEMELEKRGDPKMTMESEVYNLTSTRNQYVTDQSLIFLAKTLYVGSTNWEDLKKKIPRVGGPSMFREDRSESMNYHQRGHRGLWNWDAVAMKFDAEDFRVLTQKDVDELNIKQRVKDAYGLWEIPLPS